MMRLKLFSKMPLSTVLITLIRGSEWLHDIRQFFQPARERGSFHLRKFDCANHFERIETRKNWCWGSWLSNASILIDRTQKNWQIEFIIEPYTTCRYTVSICPAEMYRVAANFYPLLFKHSTIFLHIHKWLKQIPKCIFNIDNIVKLIDIPHMILRFKFISIDNITLGIRRLAKAINSFHLYKIISLQLL